jgi:serine/threonine protein kinase/tetratricopeptide (TPR) repeat protein
MQTIDGKYEVLEKLGEGFGGSVYLVKADGKEVALKQLHIRTDRSPLGADEILENFKQEFSTLKKLNHPHILRILDFGYDPKEKIYYFTTEYIKGKNIFEGTRGLPPKEIEELFVQIFRALGYLHSQRVCHLDIKPSNILVEETPEGKKIAKLIDFGLVAFWKKGVFAGTPAFMAPESLLDEPRDGRADLYSLGVTWYTCLTGVNPFDTEDVKKTVSLQRIWMPPPISTQLSNPPAYLDFIFEKLLQKNPADRYHRADQVIRDLNWGGSHHYPLETDVTALAYLPGEGELVGREKEWLQILSYFHRVFTTKSDSKICVILSGDAGTGKSRLLKELKFHAQLQTIPVLDLMTSNPADLKFDSLLLADDANRETFGMAEQWMKQFHTHSFLIVLAGRLLKETPGLGVRMALGNFNRANVSQYVASVLGIENPPDFLVEELYSRTEGNPLLLTELLQSLIETHQVFDEQGRWSSLLLKEVGIDFRRLRVPKTMGEYCRNKYVGLSSSAQQLLSVVALTQAPLDRIKLMKLGLGFEPSDFETLQKENLIQIDPVQGEMRLANPSFRDWVPQNVEASIVASLHQALGDLLSQDLKTQEASWFHWGHGMGNRNERFDFLSRYGDALFQQNRWIEAAHVFQAASFLAPDPEEQVRTILKKVQTLFRLGRHAEALRCLEESRTILKKERENPQHWHWVQQTLREMTSLYLKEGRMDLARESLEASRVLLEEHETNPVEEMILENFKVSLLLREGKLKEAQSLSELTYQNWQSLSDESKRQVVNNELASIYLAQGMQKEAKSLFQEQAEYCQKIGNLSRRAYALYGWAESCYSLKEFGEAIKVFQECIKVNREIKNEELLFCCMNGLGNISYLQNDLENAVHYYQDALELAQHCTNVDGSFAIAINLALVFHLRGDQGSAHIFLRHVIDTLENLVAPSLPQLQYLIQAYLELGRINLDSSQHTEARDAYRDATRLIRKYPALERFRFSALLGLIQADLQLKRIQESQTFLAEVAEGNLSPAEIEELEKIKKSFEQVKKPGVSEIPLSSSLRH